MLPTKLRTHLIALVIFIAATILLTYPLSYRSAVGLTDFGDALEQAWIVGWDVRTPSDAPLRLFEAPIFYPYPHTLAYQDSLVPQSMLAMPLVLATGRVALGYNFALLVAAVLSAFGACLLGRCVAVRATTPGRPYTTISAYLSVSEPCLLASNIDLRVGQILRV